MLNETGLGEAWEPIVPLGVCRLASDGVLGCVPVSPTLQGEPLPTESDLLSCLRGGVPLPLTQVREGQWPGCFVSQGLVTFEGVAVYFSLEEWEGWTQTSWELYKEIMRENYGILVSLGEQSPPSAGGMLAWPAAWGLAV